MYGACFYASEKQKIDSMEISIEPLMLFEDTIAKDIEILIYWSDSV